MKQTKTPLTVDDYISGFNPDIQERLRILRTTIQKAAPAAEEKISYGMPAFTLKGMLVYYAAHTKHIGFYPFTTAIEAFREELSAFKTAKGTVQFPNENPLPVELISEIVKFRVEENLFKAEIKAAKKNKK
jgi:uncharacterized protein YdhG (YjbR/CyaY superfamily)